MKKLIAKVAMSALLLIPVPLIRADEKQSKSASSDDIIAGLFFGELYPSGNIYVQNVGSPDKRKSWPQDLKFRGMKENIIAADSANADFVKSVSDEYPPGAEGMDRTEGLNDNHNQACGWHYTFHPELKYSESESDYFETVLDYCERDSELGLYKTHLNIKEAHNIVALSGNWNFGELDYSSKGKPRPMTNQERKEVVTEKQSASKDKDCTAVPQFLDSAEQMGTFVIQGSPYTLRISNYVNAGCGGHQQSIYIVDVLGKDGLQKKVQVSRYFGPI